MKLIIEGTTEELKEFFGEGTIIGFLDKSELENDEYEDCTKEISKTDLSKMKYLNAVAEATAKFLMEKSS